MSEKNKTWGVLLGFVLCFVAGIVVGLVNL